MELKRGLEAHRDLLLVLITAAVALGGIYQYSQSINVTPSTEYVLIEYQNDLPAAQPALETGMMSNTGNLVREQAPPQVARLMNEPPSAYRFRTKYGCYKRCTCSYADTCQCFYGGCFTVDDQQPTPERKEPDKYSSVGTKRLKTAEKGWRQMFGPAHG